MTAEIFLAQFLATICAFIVMSVFWRTVWAPLATYLMKSALARSCPTVPPSMIDTEGVYPGSCTDAADLVEHMKSFHLGEQLQVAALEMPEPGAERGHEITKLLEAADAFRRGTPVQKRRQIRAMAAHTKIMQESGNDSPGQGA